MKRFSLFCFIFLFMISAAICAAGEVKLVACTYSDRYHLSTCKIAQKIDSSEIVEFKTPEEAIAAGFNPCKKCNPPAKSKQK